MRPTIFTETRLHGLPISDGIACAPVCLLNEQRHSSAPIYHIDQTGVASERERMQGALNAVARKLDGLVQEVTERIGRPEAEIFAALKLMISDAGLQQRLLNTIESSGCNAEAAVVSTFDAYESRLQVVGDEYIRERAADIRDLRQHLLDALGALSSGFRCGGMDHCHRGRDRIVVAEELTPSLTVSLDVRRTRGFLTARGGENSHAAILARAFGIPAVSGIEGVTEWLSCGTEVLINGLTGEVIIWPGNEARATVELAPARRPLPDNGDGPVKGLVVMANISSAEEVAEACAYGAEGVGLYRTEFEFLTAGVALTEEMQYERYAEVVKAMQGKPVTIRLLDIGGDKELRFLDVAEERNPSLGCRGARFLIARPEFLAAQARALARASRYGPVNVLYPMIASHAQFMTLKRMFMEAITDIEPGELYHGVLFEVPAACLEAAALLRDADFGSIGTNDLVQYLYAVDRNNERVAKEYEPDQPVIWSLIRSIAETARELGKPLAICGELGGDPRHIAKVIEHGVSAVSTNARSIPGVRAAARAAFTDT